MAARTISATETTGTTTATAMVPPADKPWLEDAAVVDSAAESVAEDELVADKVPLVGEVEVSVIVA